MQISEMTVRLLIGVNNNIINRGIEGLTRRIGGQGGQIEWYVAWCLTWPLDTVANWIDHDKRNFV